MASVLQSWNKLKYQKFYFPSKIIFFCSIYTMKMKIIFIYSLCQRKNSMQYRQVVTIELLILLIACGSLSSSMKTFFILETKYSSFWWKMFSVSIYSYVLSIKQSNSESTIILHYYYNYKILLIIIIIIKHFNTDFAVIRKLGKSAFNIVITIHFLKKYCFSFFSRYLKMSKNELLLLWTENRGRAALFLSFFFCQPISFKPISFDIHCSLYFHFYLYSGTICLRFLEDTKSIKSWILRKFILQRMYF